MLRVLNYIFLEEPTIRDTVIRECFLVMVGFVTEGFEWLKLSEKTGKFELTGEPLKVEPLGLAIISFLLGILIVQTAGMFMHRLSTLIGAFNEVNFGFHPDIYFK